VFNSIFGVAWFVGSTLEGWLYDHSVMTLVVVAVVAQLLALGPLRMAARKA
jgi:predicted MFS family arabinose efflux permease